MDLNGDGRVDGRDFMLYDELYGDDNKENDPSGGGCGSTGCLGWVVVGLVVIQIIKWIA